jgi:hypothetical protein
MLRLGPCHPTQLEGIAQMRGLEMPAEDRPEMDFDFQVFLFQPFLKS